MIDTQKPEIQFALNAVREAGLIVRQIQLESDFDSLTKGDLSPVTVADFTSQALVSRRLQQTFSTDILVGEEDASDLRSRRIISGDRKDEALWLKLVDPQETEGERFSVYEEHQAATARATFT